MNQPAFLQAPAESGGILLWPEEKLVPSLLEANRQRFAQCHVEIQGKPLAYWRTFAHQEVIQLATAYLGRETTLGQIPITLPLIVSGHQPELFHPGVWIKNFVLNHLARRHQMLPLNLVIDNDVPKSALLKIPKVAGANTTPSIMRVPFAQQTPEAPYEDWVLTDLGQFHELPKIVGQVCDSWKELPILSEYWTEAARFLEEEARPGTAFARARRSQERKWGVTNLELPISILADSESFQVFLFHLLQGAESFLHLHNQAVVKYRERHSLYSNNHPFPNLEMVNGWVETPFWILTPDSPRRQRLGVKLEANGEMRLGTPGPAGIRISLGKTDHYAELSALPEKGFRIRPRAIATTLFARLFLADLFLHGIGGGKYDEVTDQLCASFFDCPAPDYLVASATLRLNLLDHMQTAGEVEAAHQRWRDSLWNPQRHTPSPSPSGWDKLVTQKQEWLALPQSTRKDRQIRYHRLRENLEAFRVLDAENLEKLRLQSRQIQEQFHAEQETQSREFPFILFSENRLRELFRPFLP